MPRPTWNNTFMEMALLISRRSKDPSTKSGAVIVNEKNIIIGLGYNGYPRGIKDITWRRVGNYLNTKYPYVCHAETNAIFNSNSRVDNCTIYCTLFPCNECAKAIIQNGIRRVVYLSDKHHDDKIYVASRKILRLAKVKLSRYDYHN